MHPTKISMNLKYSFINLCILVPESQQEEQVVHNSVNLPSPPLLVSLELELEYLYWQAYSQSRLQCTLLHR